MATRHTVRAGECLAKIAARYGFGSADALLAEPENAELVRARPNPNVLRPGDQIAIPSPQPKPTTLATGRCHRIRLQLPRKQLRIVLRDHDGEPLANTEYELDVGSEERFGSTDADGLLRERIPPDVHQVELRIHGRALTLRLGHLEPLADAVELGLVAGVQARLRNLGYDPGPSDGELGRRSKTALACFQAEHGLAITGKPDADTLAKLAEHHGC